MDRVSIAVAFLALAGSILNANGQGNYYYYDPRYPQSSLPPGQYTPVYGAGGPVQEGEGGQNPGAGGGPPSGNTIVNLIPRVPQPIWVSPDLSSLPANIPRRAEWTANVNANPGEGE